MDRKDFNVLCCGILLTGIVCMSACTKAETLAVNKSVEKSMPTVNKSVAGETGYEDEEEAVQVKAVSADDLGIIESSFVVNHLLINENPLFLFSIGDMIKDGQEILEDFSKKTEAGYLHFYINDGITYVTGEPSGEMKEEYKALLGVILTSDQYELKCGLKAGMPEKDIQRINPKFEKVSDKEEGGRQDPYLAAISPLFDFDGVYRIKERIPYEERKEYLNTELEDRRMLLFVRDGKVTAASVDYCSDSFYQFSLTEVLIENHPLLKDRLWKWASWSEIQKQCPENYTEKVSEEGADGRMVYEIGEEIIYALPQYTEGKTEDEPAAVMLTGSKYKLGCGLQVGMEEEKLRETGMPLLRYPKEKINDPNGGIVLLDWKMPEYRNTILFIILTGAL